MHLHAPGLGRALHGRERPRRAVARLPELGRTRRREGDAARKRLVAGIDHKVDIPPLDLAADCAQSHLRLHIDAAVEGRKRLLRRPRGLHAVAGPHGLHERPPRGRVVRP